MSAEKWADWCVSDDSFSMSGTHMREHSRQPDGDPRWCFKCRAQRAFEKVVEVPDGLSYYGPTVGIECTTCHTGDGDLFPGWYRTWGES